MDGSDEERDTSGFGAIPATTGAASASGAPGSLGETRKPDRLSIEAARAVGRFQTGALALGLLVLLALFAIRHDPGPVGLGVELAVWVLFVVFSLLFHQRWPERVWARTSYRVGAGGIEIESGVWWRSVVSVPRSRVQHTDVLEGPIARRYRLATLVIHTAGRSTSTVTLAGLERSEALRIRDLLAVDERRA